MTGDESERSIEQARWGLDERYAYIVRGLVGECKGRELRQTRQIAQFRVFGQIEKSL